MRRRIEVAGESVVFRSSQQAHWVAVKSLQEGFKPLRGRKAVMVGEGKVAACCCARALIPGDGRAAIGDAEVRDFEPVMESSHDVGQRRFAAVVHDDDLELTSW